jgi:DNA-binding transcriptional MerR regulator
MTVIVDNTVMIVADTYELTIEELSSEVLQLLKANNMFATAQDNRVSAAPDMRTIRYYTSLGLLDRPLIKGRVAKYSRRHVLQLLAIKMLQGTALPLSEIQEHLYGLTDSELEALIELYKADVRSEPKETAKATYWREIIIEPGLKILAESSWSCDNDQTALEEKVRAAIELFKNTASEANGEKK